MQNWKTNSSLLKKMLSYWKNPLLVKKISSLLKKNASLLKKILCYWKKCLRYWNTSDIKKNLCYIVNIETWKTIQYKKTNSSLLKKILSCGKNSLLLKKISPLLKKMLRYWKKCLRYWNTSDIKKIFATLSIVYWNWGLTFILKYISAHILEIKYCGNAVCFQWHMFLFVYPKAWLLEVFGPQNWIFSRLPISFIKLCNPSLQEF